MIDEKKLIEEVNKHRLEYEKPHDMAIGVRVVERIANDLAAASEAKPKVKGILIDADEAILSYSAMKLYIVTALIHKILEEHKVTLRGMSGEKLIFTDQATGEEYVVEDLGYPI